ncbi:AAC(3) family N-acetyltransferase [Micromonospora matsumotoense]|uniref:aminoglycoside N(3)-acetyltransferase n=1 Tax=Micromonospora matsumotoense TaxID=121616 RepID=UPI0034180ABF
MSGRSALAAATVGLTPARAAAVEAAIGPFDPARSPAQGMGAFAEHVRRQADARRSAHPQTSFAALGPTAATLTARHDLDCHLGDRSPLGALYTADALVLLLGVDRSVCTAFHLAEYRCRRPAPRRAYRCYVRDPAGGRVRRDFQAPHLDDSDFPLIGAAVVAHGSVRSGPVGSAESHCVRLRHAVDVARGWLDEHRLA